MQAAGYIIIMNITCENDKNQNLRNENGILLNESDEQQTLQWWDQQEKENN